MVGRLRLEHNFSILEWSHHGAFHSGHCQVSWNISLIIIWFLWLQVVYFHWVTKNRFLDIIALVLPSETSMCSSEKGQAELKVWIKVSQEKPQEISSSEESLNINELKPNTV